MLRRLVKRDGGSNFYFFSAKTEPGRPRGLDPLVAPPLARRQRVNATSDPSCWSEGGSSTSGRLGTDARWRARVGKAAGDRPKGGSSTSAREVAGDRRNGGELVLRTATGDRHSSDVSAFVGVGLRIAHGSRLMVFVF